MITEETKPALSDFISTSSAVDDCPEFVYLLAQDEEIVYVGRTINPSRRAYEHEIGEKNFDKIVYILVHGRDAARLERALISFLKPQYNTIYTDMGIVDADVGDWAYSHTVLTLTRRRDLWDEIEKINTMSVPEPFDTYVSREGDYGDSHYGNTQTDDYGEQVSWCFAEDLVALKDHEAEEWREESISLQKNDYLWANQKRKQRRT